MRTHEIRKALGFELKHTKVKTYYVLARNHFNEKIFHKFPLAVVINTDSWPGKGLHWVGVFYDRHRRPIFFDSLGKSPKYYDINIKPYEWNKKSYQGNSDLCGQYTLLFIKYMSRGLKLKEFQQLFSKNKERNDALIRQYFNRHLPIHDSISTKEVDQSCITNCSNGQRQRYVRL